MLPPERPQPGSGRLPWLPGHNKAGVQKGFVLSHLCTKRKSPPSLLVLWFTSRENILEVHPTLSTLKRGERLEKRMYPGHSCIGRCLEKGARPKWELPEVPCCVPMKSHWDRE